MSGIGPDGGVIGAEDDTIVHGEEGAPEGPPLPSLGDSLGRYQLQEILGQGGMGVVYRAYDPSLRRAVALKLVRPELPADVRKRFFEEAQVTAQLQHPVIIPVFEVGSAGDYLYYTMPLVRGVGLDDLIAASQGWKCTSGDPDCPLLVLTGGYFDQSLYIIDHTTPYAASGKHYNNRRALCVWCDAVKTRREVAERKHRPPTPSEDGESDAEDE